MRKIIGKDWKKNKVPIKFDKSRNILGFGVELVVNLYDCDAQKIDSKKEVEKFVIELCDKVIKMKRQGEVITSDFGHDNPTTSGLSVVQLIETSSLTGHFSLHQKSCYLNIFSCASFDLDKTANFCKDFFGAKHMDTFQIIRP